MRYRVLGLILGAVAAAASGCVGSTTPSPPKLTGEVKLDGQPVPVGSLLFETIRDAKPTGGQIPCEVKDGQYEAWSVPAGTYRVTLRVPAQGANSDGPKSAGDVAPDPVSPPAVKVTIAADEQTHAIEFSAKAK